MTRRRVLTAGAVVLALGLAAASVQAGDVAEKRAFEIADVYRAAWLGGPVLSDDGARVAFTVRRFELEEQERWSEIWMMAADGSGLRQMTFGRHHDGVPSFSPDGKTLLFVSDREGDAPQLWLLPVDGGEARKLTDFPMGLSSPIWSPDGSFIAATSDVYPECGADAECNSTISTKWSEGPLTAHLADELLYRHWTSWRDGAYTHVLLIDAKSGEVVRDLTPGRWDSPTFSLGGDVGFAFSPDGAEICFVSNHDKDPASSTNADLWVVPVEGKDAPEQPRNLTAANTGWDGDPHYSPDGRYIAFRSQAKAGFEADLFRLALLERSTGKVRYLTDRDTFDDWVDGLAWSRDGSSLFFQAEQKGRNPLFKIGLEDGTIERVLVHGGIGGWAETADGAIVYSRRTIDEPQEIFRAPLAGGEPKRLTVFNQELEAEVDFRPAEELWVKGDGDYDVHVFLVKPHGFDPAKKYPLILNVHGGPQQQWMDSFRGDWQVYPGKGYVVAFCNPTGSPGYGQDLVDAISCDWGGRVYRDLMKVTDHLAELPYVDADRIGAMGWSYGGYMMMWFQGHTDRFKAIASMMGVYDLRSMYSATEELWFPEYDLCGPPWESDDYQLFSPSAHVKSFKTPCLVITGELDYRVPYTQSLQFFTDLQKMEVPSRLAVFPKAGHWPSWYEMTFYYLLHLDWFHTYLGGEAPPWEVEKFLRNQVFGEQEEEQS